MSDSTAAWSKRRHALLGRTQGTRESVARALGLGLRTVQRYELGQPPTWYLYALMGLAEAKKNGAGS